jgi:hypothetical protein
MAEKKSKARRTLRLNKYPVQAYLEKEQMDGLDELSKRTRVAKQIYIREGIDYVLKRYSPGNIMKLYIRQLAEKQRKGKS